VLSSSSSEISITKRTWRVGSGTPFLVRRFEPVAPARDKAEGRLAFALPPANPFTACGGACVPSLGSPVFLACEPPVDFDTSRPAFVAASEAPDTLAALFRFFAGGAFVVFAGVTFLPLAGGE